MKSQRENVYQPWQINNNLGLERKYIASETIVSELDTVGNMMRVDHIICKVDESKTDSGAVNN